ncbi:MAG: branched-chain amino acid ABC transporter substrate-binding protein [Actinomycetia bacterium]|nr:branched-chain amino acid ABC transporter substrate-binding protein [Actinomycetes bacterium]
MKNLFSSRGKYIKIMMTVIIIAVTAIVGLNASSCDTRERIIKIGNQAVLSGEYRSFGEEQLVSLELAVSTISPVMIGGFEYNIELISRDDEGNPEKAFLIARELVDQGVSIVIGSTFDGTTRVSIPVYEEYNIPLISPFSQKTETAGEGDNFFRVIINNRQKIENIADFIIEEARPRRLVLIDNREEYSENLVDYIQELLAEKGQEVLGEPYSIEFSKEDLAVVAGNLLIDEPDYIFCVARYDELALLMKETGNIGIDAGFITETMGMSENIFTAAENSDLEGLIAIIPEPPSTAMYTTDQGAIDFWHSYNDMLAVLKEDRELSIDGPGQYAPYAYDAILLAIESMKRSNSILPQDFMEELRATSYEGITGHIEFDSNGDRTAPLSTVFTIKDGAWVRYN